MTSPGNYISSTQDTTGLPGWLSTALMSPVNLFQLYRLLLALFILITFFTHSGPIWLGFFYPGLFTSVSIIYLAFVVTSMILTQLDAIQPENNIQIMIFSDILLITLLMHASGGVQTGMGILLAISVTAGSLLLRGRLALAFASLATVTVIAEQFSTYLNPLYVSPDFVQSAMLGLAFFAIALLSHSLAQHIQASEQLALRTRQDLNSMAQLSEHVIGHMKEGVIAINNKRNIKLINNAAWQLLNKQTPDEDMNIDRICPELSEKLTSRQPTLQGKTSFNLTLAANDKKPSREIKVTLNTLGSTKKEGMLIFLDDLTEMTHQAQQLKLASIGRLTASIAHEIRNPLGAISHAGQLLCESQTISTDDQRLTEIITNNSARMNQIIENVLNLSKRDSARPVRLKIKPWLSDIRTKILQATGLQPQQIVLSVKPDDLEGNFDADQIDQALTILAQNAISHFDRDLQHLAIQFQCTRQDEDILLECIDNGPGITENEARQIFEPFFTTQHSGTGLGLYIARELVESNKAQISYSPIDPHGSNFKIFFANQISQESNT